MLTYALLLCSCVSAVIQQASMSLCKCNCPASMVVFIFLPFRFFPFHFPFPPFFSLAAAPLLCVHGDRQCVCAVQELIRSGADDVKSKALQTAGNLAFCHQNRSLLLQAEGFKEVMVRMADQGAVVKHEVRMSAIRALAILGELSLMNAVLMRQQSVFSMADQGAVVKHEARMSAIRALAILGELHYSDTSTSDVWNGRFKHTVVSFNYPSVIPEHCKTHFCHSDVVLGK